MYSKRPINVLKALLGLLLCLIMLAIVDFVIYVLWVMTIFGSSPTESAYAFVSMVLTANQLAGIAIALCVLGYLLRPLSIQRAVASATQPSTTCSGI